MSQREPTPDRQGMQQLTREECLGLLEKAEVGRLVFVDDRQPLALPVNHGVFGGDVVFRTTEGSKLESAREEGSRVAFECDEWNASERGGWSVLVKGTLELVADADERAQLEDLGLEAWADTVERDDWMRVRAEDVTGRRLLGSDG